MPSVIRRGVGARRLLGRFGMGCGGSVVVRAADENGGDPVGAIWLPADEKSPLGEDDISAAGTPVEKIWLQPSEKPLFQPGLSAESLPSPCSTNLAFDETPVIVDEDEAKEKLAQVEPTRSSYLRDYTDEERRAAWRLAGSTTATADQVQPLAIWIIGPSAVGKSTLTRDLAPEYGVPRLGRDLVNEVDMVGIGSSCSWSVPGLGLDAVIVDGEVFREVHASYQEWTQTGDWAAAYPQLKPLINKEKDALLKGSAAQRKHLLIPQTCLNLKNCTSTIQHLTDCGYTNHVIAIAAPKEEVARRGRAREQAVRKRYAPVEFDRSLAAFGPMIRAANGRYQVIRAHLPSDTSSASSVSSGAETEAECPRLEREVLAEGTCDPDVLLPDLAAIVG